MSGSAIQVATKATRDKILKCLQHSPSKRGHLKRSAGPAAVDSPSLFVCSTSSDIAAMTDDQDHRPSAVGDLVLWHDINTAKTWHVVACVAFTATDNYEYADLSGAVVLAM